MKDYVIPSGNEREFILKAELFGFKELVLFYSLNKFDSADLAKLQDTTKLKLTKAILAEKKDIFPAKKKGLVAVKADVENRAILEIGPDIVFGFEEASKRDYLHHHGSGFNQVLAKIAKDRGVSAGFSLSSLLRADRVLRCQIIGRMHQNKMLFNKYKVEYLVASFAEKPEEMRPAEEMRAFMRIV